MAHKRKSMEQRLQPLVEENIRRVRRSLTQATEATVAGWSVPLMLLSQGSEPRDLAPLISPLIRMTKSLTSAPQVLTNEDGDMNIEPYALQEEDLRKDISAQILILQQLEQGRQADVDPEPRPTGGNHPTTPPAQPV